VHQETEIFRALREELREDLIEESRINPDRPLIVARSGTLIPALRLLVEKFHARLCTITAVDTGTDFELIYHMSIKGLVTNLKIFVPKEESEVASATSIIPGAASAEREIWDLFKIRFQGLSDSRALIVPYEWRDTKHPLRKPMGGIVAEYQKPTVETLMQQGQVFTMPSTVKGHRQNLRLPEVETTMTRPEALKELHELAEEGGFDKRVGYDWKKKKLRY